jgi:hypothetical protein
MSGIEEDEIPNPAKLAKKLVEKSERRAEAKRERR